MNIPFMKPKPPFPRFPNMGRDVVSVSHDLDEEMRLEVANRLPQAPQLPVSEYAPRLPIKRVETFMALSRKEVDDAMATLTAQYEAAKARGQHLLDLIAVAQEEHLANLDRERAFAEFTKEAFDVLELKFDGLNQPVEAPKDEPTEELPS